MKRITTIAVAALVLVALLFLGGGSYLPVTAQSDSHYFNETGHTVKGRFLTYWNQHGGLSQFGYPLTEEFTEVSDLNGKPYTVQYFERAVFEHHPENQPPYDVLLSQLGTYRLHQKYPNGAPTPTIGRIDAPLNAVELGSTENGWAVGESGAIYQYSSGVWQKTASPTQNTLYGMYISAKGLGYAVGAGGTILSFSDSAPNGNNWRVVNSPTTADLYGVAQSDLGVYWFVGNGVIVENFVGKWTVQQTPNHATLTSVDMVNADEGWAVGYMSTDGQSGKGIIMHYSNGQWQQFGAPFPSPLNRVRMLDANNGWIVGAGGAILHYGGGHWVAVSSPTTAALHDVSIVSASEAWAVGSDLLHYSNGQWSKVANPLAANGTMNALRILIGASPMEGWAVGASGNPANPGAILHFVNGSWTMYTGQ